MGNEDKYVKSKVNEATKIVFTKHNACWLVHTPDYKQPTSEVLSVVTSEVLQQSSGQDLQECLVTTSVHGGEQ